MIRPIDTAAVSRSELAELLGARQERVGGRHGGVEADLLGDRLHPVGVVVVGDQHDLVGASLGEEAAEWPAATPRCWCRRPP